MNELDAIQNNHRDDRLLNDVINNNNTANTVANDLKSLKGTELTESPTPDDTDGDALSPRKHHMLNNHHNNNDVSFVLIVQEDQAGEDLHSGDEDVSQLSRLFSNSHLYFIFQYLLYNYVYPIFLPLCTVLKVTNFLTILDQTGTQ